MILYSLGGLDDKAEGHMLNGKGRDIINSCPFADRKERSGQKLICDHLIKLSIVMHMSN